jgi:pimeloyl-ACP methyl ester carboxylesterase
VIGNADGDPVHEVVLAGPASTHEVGGRCFDRLPGLRRREPTVLCIPGSISNLMLADGTPALARFWERLGRFARVVRFDKRGTGLSDRSAADAARIDQQVPDVDAVRAAAGADRVILNGLSQGAAVAVRYALQYPERVAKLILFEGVCCDAHDPSAPASAAEPIIDWDQFFGDLETDFGAFSRRLAQTMNPSAPDTVVDMYADFLRATASPQSLRSLWQSIVGLDLRPVLEHLDVPTLIISRASARAGSLACAEDDAAIPSRLPGRDHRSQELEAARYVRNPRSKFCVVQCVPGLPPSSGNTEERIVDWSMPSQCFRIVP